MSLKKAYLYLVSVISLIIAVVGAIMILNLVLKTWVFPKAEQAYQYNPCDDRLIRAPVMDEGEKKIEPCTEEEKAMYDEQEKENRSAQKQRDAAQALAMILVATPVWWGHWRLAKRES